MAFIKIFIIYKIANQELVGHIANGKTYFYLKNAQGDITAVINEEGLCVKIYNYSAWGKDVNEVTPDLSTYTNDVNGARLGSSISNFYRGYEYAEGLTAYYLQSRYYDCYWLNRFINADVPQIAQQNKNEHYGLNLFAYCANNPVMFSDPTGDEAAALVATGIAYTALFVCGVLLIYILVEIIVACLSGIDIDSVGGISLPNNTTKIFPDVKAKAQSGKHYHVAYISNYGCLIKIGPKLTFIQALGALGITTTTNSVNKRYEFVYRSSKVNNYVRKTYSYGVWGIYADSQQSAKALAVVLGGYCVLR